MENKEIARIRDKKTGKWVTVPTDMRPTIEAYKVFKRPAYEATRRRDISEQQAKG